MSSKTILAYMSEELPTIPAQKRLVYRTDEKEIRQLFKMLNKTVFENKLPTPRFRIIKRTTDYWGQCEADDFNPNPNTKKSNCIIYLSSKWYCKQWLIDSLAHEMCHQYQWDVLSKERARQGLGPIMSHGPSFYIFRDKLKEHGIPLKRYHRIHKWWKYQNLFKC